MLVLLSANEIDMTRSTFIYSSRYILDRYACVVREDKITVIFTVTWVNFLKVLDTLGD